MKLHLCLEDPILYIDLANNTYVYVYSSIKDHLKRGEKRRGMTDSPSPPTQSRDHITSLADQADEDDVSVSVNTLVRTA